MKDRTLVVVDMQPLFPSSNDERTLSAVERELRTAMENGWAIAILEIPYSNELSTVKNPPTHQRLLDVIKGYPRQILVYKYREDGSRNLVEECQKSGLPSDYFRICGVNADMCVLATARGLAVNMKVWKVEVVKDACNHSGLEDEESWPKYTAPNIALI